jgi:hypothetical protein
MNRASWLWLPVNVAVLFSGWMVYYSSVSGEAALAGTVPAAFVAVICLAAGVVGIYAHLERRIKELERELRDRRGGGA